MRKNPIPMLFLLIAVVIIIVLAATYATYRESSDASLSSSVSSTSSVAGTAQTASSSSPASPSASVAGINASASGYTITPIYAPKGPDSATPLVFSSDLSVQERAVYQSRFSAIQKTLASNPVDWSSWIDLGTLRKEAGDYAGAAADWAYVTKLYPKNAVAFANLGDLYANFMHEPSQGESYYKQAIAIDPTQEVYYANLAAIYQAQGDTADARATLQEGINAKVIGYQNLETVLNSL